MKPRRSTLARDPLELHLGARASARAEADDGPDEVIVGRGALADHAAPLGPCVDCGERAAMVFAGRARCLGCALVVACAPQPRRPRRTGQRSTTDANTRQRVSSARRGAKR